MLSWQPSRQDLAQRGARVIIGCRNRERGKKEDTKKMKKKIH